MTISGSNSKIFVVNSGTTLAMTNLTLSNGFIQGSGNAGYGGAIFNAGTLQMTGCAIISNSAVGAGGALTGATDGGGGGIYSTGIATAWGCVFVGNSAVGGFGGSYSGWGWPQSAEQQTGVPCLMPIRRHSSIVFSPITPPPAESAAPGTKEDPIMGYRAEEATAAPSAIMAASCCPTVRFACNFAVGGTGGQGSAGPNYGEEMAGREVSGETPDKPPPALFVFRVAPPTLSIPRFGAMSVRAGWVASEALEDRVSCIMERVAPEEMADRVAPELGVQSAIWEVL